MHAGRIFLSCELLIKLVPPENLQDKENFHPLVKFHWLEINLTKKKSHYNTNIIAILLCVNWKTVLCIFTFFLWNWFALRVSTSGKSPSNLGSLSCNIPLKDVTVSKSTRSPSMDLQHKGTRSIGIYSLVPEDTFESLHKSTDNRMQSNRWHFVGVGSNRQMIIGTGRQQPRPSWNG